MGFFETLKHKSAAKKAGLTYEQYLEFLAMAAEKGYSLDGYRMHLKAVDCNMTDEQYLMFCNARAIGLSLDQFLEYWRNYRDQYILERFYQYCQAQKENLSLEQYDEWKKDYSSLSADRFHELLKARQLNMSLIQYDEYLSEFSSKMSAEQFLLYCDARSIGLSLDQFLEYCRNYRDQYTLERFYQYCQAQKENISLEQYDEWKKDYSSLPAARFRNLLEARKQNINLEVYEELQNARQLGLTVEQYREKKLADSLGISVVDLPFYRACEENQANGKNFTAVTSWDEVKIANKLRIEKIILVAEKFKTLPNRAFWGCDAFHEIVLPWGVQEIGQYAFGNCTALETITIPGSVKSLPRGVFDGCHSLRVIELISGIEKVDITGWADLPALKTVASAGSISEFEIDKSKNYHKFSRSCYDNCYYFDHSKYYGEESEKLWRVRNSVEILELEDVRDILSLENFPNLKVLIFDTRNFNSIGLNKIKNCPQLHTVIINGADQTDYFTKSGSLRKRVEYEKRLSISAEGIMNQLKFLIIKSNLLRISSCSIHGADGKYSDSIYSRLSWLHVPSETEYVSVLAPNLSEIGVSSSCYVAEDSVKKLLINEYIYSDSDVLMVSALDSPVYETSFSGLKKDTGKKREKLLVYCL